MMIRKTYWLSAAVLSMAASIAHAGTVEQLAAAFGNRGQVLQTSLSPSGNKIAFVAPMDQGGEAVFVVDLEKDGKPNAVFRISQEGAHLTGCRWPTEAQLICNMRATSPFNGLMIGFSRLYVVEADGSGVRSLTPDGSHRALGLQQFGGNVVAYDVKGQRNKVLMTRQYLPDFQTGTRVFNQVSGMGVDMVDVVTMEHKQVEPPREGVVGYLADATGNVRIMAKFPQNSSGYIASKVPVFSFRRPGSSQFETLTPNRAIEEFAVYEVDAANNVAIGIGKENGFAQLYSVALDGSGATRVLLSHRGSDVDELVEIGRANRVVGGGFATERRQREIFDPALKKLLADLGAALPGDELFEIVDANADESKLLLIARSDVNPGMIYLFDKATSKLEEVLPLRTGVQGLPLSPMRALTYTAADGTRIPAYLTLPPGAADLKGLPAIVMPHGGPEARDEWGFDWLAQFYAQRGFAVLQPNFRGSAGYGEAWMVQNGFKSWETAIGDVNDAGRWMVAQGADPAKLAAVGWSYGGYAALQAAATDPSLFKAVVAIAPVTDLDLLRQNARHFANYALVSDFLGHGEYLDRGSPKKQAGKIAAPVMLVHGTLDESVEVRHSDDMAGALRSAGKQPLYLKFEGQGHSLADSAARSRMLAESDKFLRAALRM
jgi:dipeptidyl aminopeptidase/acylaminoacyl peptidase